MADRRSEVRFAPKRSESNVIQSKGLEKKIEFKFFAPLARNVALAGTFNSWSVDSFPLKPSRDGQWKGALNLTPGRYEYRYVIDGRWESDPATDSVPNSFGSTNCILEVR